MTFPEKAAAQNKKPTGIASAAVLVASHCIEVAEDMGADHEQILSVVNSAINARTDGDIMILTVGTSTGVNLIVVINSIDLNLKVNQFSVWNDPKIQPTFLHDKTPYIFALDGITSTYFPQYQIFLNESTNLPLPHKAEIGLISLLTDFSLKKQYKCFIKMTFSPST
ncbi:VAN3-binding -like, partial [Olea europaea subsp. europaea]